MLSIASQQRLFAFWRHRWPFAVAALLAALIVMASLWLSQARTRATRADIQVRWNWRRPAHTPSNAPGVTCRSVVSLANVLRTVGYATRAEDIQVTGGERASQPLDVTQPQLSPGTVRVCGGLVPVVNESVRNTNLPPTYPGFESPSFTCADVNVPLALPV